MAVRITSRAAIRFSACRYPPVEDTATFAGPFQYPAGIRLVVVNGSVALRDGARAAERAGRALRAGA